MPKVRNHFVFWLLRSAAVFRLAKYSNYVFVENLRQVSSERDSTSTRVAELEAQVLSLREEVASAKREAATALGHAETTESREEVAAKQEEELTPRVQALVNSLSGDCFNSSYLLNFSVEHQC